MRLRIICFTGYLVNGRRDLRYGNRRAKSIPKSGFPGASLHSSLFGTHDGKFVERQPVCAIASRVQSYGKSSGHTITVSLCTTSTLFYIDS